MLCGCIGKGEIGKVYGQVGRHKGELIIIGTCDKLIFADRRYAEEQGALRHGRKRIHADKFGFCVKNIVEIIGAKADICADNAAFLEGYLFFKARKRRA